MLWHTTTGSEIRIKGGKLTADSAGLRLVPWPFRRGVLIPWQQIEYVSPVPGLRTVRDGWTTYRGDR
jgi:hypothetical protein